MAAQNLGFSGDGFIQAGCDHVWAAPQDQVVCFSIVEARRLASETCQIANLTGSFFLIR